jgi:hypothetical protein
VNSPGDGPNCEVIVEMRLEYKNNDTTKPTFSVCGEVWYPNKSDVFMCGQCIDSIWEYYGDQIKDKDLFLEIKDLWEKYHLNDMNAGTLEQTRALKGKRFDYTEACEYLKEKGLYEVDTEIDGRIMTYKYGHSWLYNPIPEADLLRIKKIMETP